MLPTTLPQVEEALGAAKNLNAALKNILKKEAGNNEALQRFLKEFRAAVSTGRAASLTAFIAAHYPQQEALLLVVARYAHANFIAPIIEKVIEQHADKFNATYSVRDEKIEIKEPGAFCEIAKAAVLLMETSLQEAKLPANNFMKMALMTSLFEEAVLPEVIKCLN